MTEMAGPIAGRAVVLVADDEVLIRDLVVKWIHRLGLIGVGVADGAAAVAAVVQHCEQLCCVILDLDMPIMNGVEAAHAIQQIAPDVAIVLISGSLQRYQEISNSKLRLSGALNKPFSFQTLSDMIQQIAYGSEWQGMPH
jgi:two-component system, cell cycle sensor histidine kinase and response regulator CckA